MKAMNNILTAFNFLSFDDEVKRIESNEFKKIESKIQNTLNKEINNLVSDNPNLVAQSATTIFDMIDMTNNEKFDFLEGKWTLNDPDGETFYNTYNILFKNGIIKFGKGYNLNKLTSVYTICDNIAVVKISVNDLFDMAFYLEKVDANKMNLLGIQRSKNSEIGLYEEMSNVTFIK